MFSRRHLRRQSGLRRADVHERLVHHQQPPMASQRIGESEQLVLGDDASIRIIGIDDDREVGAGKLTDVARIDHRMAGERRRARVLRIGRPEDCGTARRHEGLPPAAAVSGCPATP